MGKLLIANILIILLAVDPSNGNIVNAMLNPILKELKKENVGKVDGNVYCSLDFDGDNYVDSFVQIISTKLKDKYDPFYTLIDHEIMKAIKIFGLSTLQRVGHVQKACDDGQLVLTTELGIAALQAEITLHYQLVDDYWVHGHLIVNVINPKFRIILKYSPEAGRFILQEGESSDEGVVDNLFFRESYGNLFNGRFRQFLNLLLEGGAAAFKNIAFLRVPLIVDDVINGTYPLPNP